MELKEYAISDIASLKYGKMLVKNKFTEKGYPVFSGYKITGYTSEYLYKEPEVIVVARGVGGTGDVKMSPPMSWITNLSIILSVDTKIVDKFFFKELLHAENLKLKLDSGASISQITINSLESYKVKLPDISFQKYVRDILIKYDHLIENNNRRIAILEEMAQSLYREWFVHFRYPNNEDNYGIDGNSKLVDSPFGKIPEGWEVKTLKDVLELAYGKALKKADRKGGYVAVYGSGGIGGYHDKSLVSGPCIIVGRKGNVGKTFWVDQDCWPIDTVFYVKSNFSKFYLYYNLLNQKFFNSDAAVPGLNRESAYSNKIVIPPSELVEMFDNFVQPVFEQKYTLLKVNKNLKCQRDILLPKLISGEIKL